MMIFLSAWRSSQAFRLASLLGILRVWCGILHVTVTEASSPGSVGRYVLAPSIHDHFSDACRHQLVRSRSFCSGVSSNPAVVNSLPAVGVFHHHGRSRRGRLFAAPTGAPRSSAPTDDEVRLCSVSSSVIQTLVRGAALRMASDLTGGTPLESLKTRVTTTCESLPQAFRSIVSGSSNGNSGGGGLGALWAGTPSRMVEGALVGACFLVASRFTQRQLVACQVPPTVAALAGGLVGGVAQATIMTPAGMVFTTLQHRRTTHHSNSMDGSIYQDTAWTVARDIVSERGVCGLYAGVGPMCWRQATNWASRAGFTEVARTAWGWSKWGLAGELTSGVVGGLVSCWNTPIESARILAQRDGSTGQPIKPIAEYWRDAIREGGYPALFRGVSPRALQSVWQTTFMVVVPNLMGI